MLQRPKYAWSREGGVFALAAGSQRIHLWSRAFEEAMEPFDEAVLRKPERILDVPASALIGLVFVDATTLVTIHAMGEVHAFDVERLCEKHAGLEEPGLDGPAQSSRWTRNFRTSLCAFAAHRCSRSERLMIALGAESGEVFLLAANGAEAPGVARGRGHRDAVVCLTFSGDDCRLASSARDRVIQIWSTEHEFSKGAEIEELLPLTRLEGSGGWPLTMAFSHDHRHLVSGGMDNGLYLWELDAPRPLQYVSQEHHGWLSDVAFTDDDRRIVSASWDNSVGVFDVDRLKPLLRLNFHKDYVSRVLLDPSTSRLIAGSYDGKISAWDIDAGKLLGVAAAHTDWILDLMGVGSDRFISIASDRSVRLWLLEELRCRAIYGEKASMGFEIGGTMGWKDFGLGGLSVAVDTSLHKPEALFEAHAVRRYDADEQEQAAGKEQTVMELLDAVADKSSRELLDNDVVRAAEAQDDWFEDWQHSHPDSEPLDGPAERIEKQEDDLSSLVLEAIVDERDRGKVENKVDDSPKTLMSLPFAGLDENEDDPKTLMSLPFAGLDDESEPEPLEDALDEPIPIEDAMDVSEWVPEQDEFDEAFEDSVASEVSVARIAPAPLEAPHGLGASNGTEVGPLIQTPTPRPPTLRESSAAIPPRELPAKAKKPALSLAERLKARRAELQEKLAAVEPIPARVEPDVQIIAPVEIKDETGGIGSQGTVVGFKSAASPDEARSPGRFHTLSESTPVEEDATRELSREALGFALGRSNVPPLGASRLAKGAVEAEPLSLPIPGVEEEFPGNEGLSVIEISSAELWDRGTASPAGMGIIKRKVATKAEYKPITQLRTSHTQDLRCGLDGKQKRLVSGARDESVSIWNVLTGERVLRFRIGPGGTGAVGFLAESHLVYALGRDGRVHLWLLPRTSSGKDARPMHTSLAGHDDAITCGVVHPRRKHLLTGSRDGTARLWSLQDGQCVAVLAGQDAPVVGVTYGDKGPITASEDGKIRIWNQQGFQIDQIDANGALTAIDSFAGALCWAQAGGAVHTMREGESKSRRLWGHYGEARSVSFRSDGGFATAGEDGRILIYTAQEDKPFQEIQLPAPISQVSLGERVLAAACEGGAIYVFKRSS